ncbi:hypothetical protein J1614_007705 [Plenodomus biglobosus]|nr:hypothetical protein J1614_007705 [Plenodomus biglobosus]
MDLATTPPYSEATTPPRTKHPDDPDSPALPSPQQDPPTRSATAHLNSIHDALFATDLTPALVNADPLLKRVQQDLLILSSLNENSTLHWRPPWFYQGHRTRFFWTLYNPPNVVTELLPQPDKGRTCYTRRLRCDTDPPPVFIKSWEAWARYRRIYGIPWTFLCEEHIELIRMGLCRNERGEVCAPPTYPLYPEPQPLGRGRYILDPATYRTHLPAKFHFVRHDAEVREEVEVVVVQSNGALTVERSATYYVHPSQWTHYTGNGGYQLDDIRKMNVIETKFQGPGRRWSYLPWTEEQEQSCRAQLVVRLKVGGTGKKRGDALLRRLRANK